jgi:hypothetical protein
MTAPDLLNALADVIANLRGMYDDTDGETHMPREDSDEICKAVTEMAKALDCKDDWGHVADALRAHATTLTPGLPEGWGWAPTKNIVMAQSLASDDCAWVNGDGIVSATKAPVDVVRAVLARAGVGS